MSSEPTNPEPTNPESASSESVGAGKGVAKQVLQLLAAGRAGFLAAGRRTQMALTGGVLLLAAGVYLISGDADDIAMGTTFEVRRGPFEVVVLEGGNVEAVQSQQIRSLIKGREGVKILEIVEEGYRVTREDVGQGLVLVELDSAQLEAEKLNQEIAVEAEQASLIERRAQLEIRINQNVSSINSAMQAMKFARLDFEKFLGHNVVAEIVATLDIDNRLAASERAAELMSNALNDQALGTASPRRDGRQLMGLDPSRQDAEGGDSMPLELVELNPVPVDTSSVMLMDESYMRVRSTLDFSVYASTARLEDGEAKQMLRELEDALRVAEEDHLQAQARLDGQRRLEERGFITPTELELEEVKVIKTQIRLDSAETALRLYQQYSFPKEAEQALANYEDAIMSYQRTRAEGQAELAQAEARYKAAEKRLNLAVEKLDDLNNQLAATVIRAERPGLVVYGSADQNNQGFRGNNQEPIQVGATVRERQPILTIPDLTEMAVRVNIHESVVQRVGVGQTVKLRVDAFPDIALTGVVSKVAVVADSSNSFMNPDLKVYPSMVTIDGTHDWLRPGMSAQVEILVERLEDAVYVPLQAVTYYGDEQVVYVVRNGRSERRVVEVGSFSEQFIQILEGVVPGEEVMLLPPREDSSAVARI